MSGGWVRMATQACAFLLLNVNIKEEEEEKNQKNKSGIFRSVPHSVMMLCGSAVNILNHSLQT